MAGQIRRERKAQPMVSEARAFFGNVPGGEGSQRNSIALDLPAFQLWRRSELPAEWRSTSVGTPTRQIAVALELPDTPGGRTDYGWACERLTSEPEATYVIPDLLTSRYDFRGLRDERGRRQAAADDLRNLIESGKPPPHLARLLEKGPERR